MAARTRSRFDRDEVGPRNDVYTGLLAISLVAMLVSCVLLFLDYQQYGGKPVPPLPAAPQIKGPAVGSLPPPPPLESRPAVLGTAEAPVKPVSGVESGIGSLTPAVAETPSLLPPVPLAPTPSLAPPTPTPVAEPLAPMPVVIPAAEMPPPSTLPGTNGPKADANSGEPPPLPKSIKNLPNGGG